MSTRLIVAVLGIALALSTAGCRKQGEIVTPASEGPAGATSGGIHRVDASGGKGGQPQQAPSAVGARRMSVD
ncbi:MAG: hypothetical protein FJX72_08830 [Armatimonadetes bacterium]|nr:hypothetical protein [Armatimonadota bacterium]